jgi:hypothetical protein
VLLESIAEPVIQAQIKGEEVDEESVRRVHPVPALYQFCPKISHPSPLTPDTV